MAAEFLQALARVGALALVLCAATSCGGGGGDGGGAASSSFGVGLTNVTPARTDLDINAGEGAIVQLRGTLVGDLSLLNGRTLFIIVEDPSGAFVPATTSVAVTGTTGEVTLTGPALNATGTISGTLRVAVCLDLQCTTQIRNTPVLVPYRVTVHPTLSVPPTISITAPFGVQPAPLDVPITLPFGFNTAMFFPTSAPAPWITVEVVPGPPAFLRVTAMAQPVGRVTYPPVTLQTVSNSSFGTRIQTQAFVVTYEVTPSSNPVALAPTSASFTIPLSTIPVGGRAQYAKAFAQPGAGTFTGARVVIDNPTVPPGGDPAAPYGSWLSYSPSAETLSVTACSPACMLTGTYTGRLIHTLTNGSAVTEYTVPVTLTVAP